MTADSTPSRAAALGVECAPAADARLTSDLLTETQRHARGAVNRRGLVDTVEFAFGRHLFDQRARSGVEAARERASRLAEASGGVATATAITFAADVFVALAVERSWRREDAESVVVALRSKLGIDANALAVRLLVAGLQAPQLAEVPPLVALDVQLSLLLSFSQAVEASVWTKDETGRPECIVANGDTATTRRFRAVAKLAFDGTRVGDTSLVIGTRVKRWQSPWGAVVVRVRSREGIEGPLEEVAAAISLVVEREFLLRRSAARERSLVTASERRLSRLGFDLHDGALQHVATLAVDMTRLRRRAPASLGLDFDALERQLADLDRILRELAHSLEPSSLLRRPLEEVVYAEAEALRERTGIDVRTRVAGDFGSMTPSQHIALIRVLQEACTNIREHSGATNVEVTLTGARSSVELQISDDGHGFEVARTLQDAAQRGRLGLVGSSERVRLLGGTFDIRSHTGGPTTLSLTLPRWQPIATEDETPPQLALS